MRDFWLRSPIYIVICVLLGFVIAALIAQNAILRDQLADARQDIADIKQQQKESEARGDRIEENTDRVIAYLRCISLTPVGERTPELIDKCLTEDLPPQASSGQAQSGPVGNAQTPGPIANQPQQNNGGQPVDNSPNMPTTPTPSQPETPGRSGLLNPITNPLCTNLTPRVCATLGL